MSQSQTTETRLPQIDGLRAIAIIAVVLFHYVNNQLTQTHGWLASNLSLATSFGWCGVDLFFVLSGFLITRILLKRVDSPSYFRTFYARRSLRILPVYFLFLLTWFLVVRSGMSLESNFLNQVSAVPFWSYFLMVQNIIMAQQQDLGNPVLSLTWSIGIEEQFYVLFPFVVFLFKFRNLVALLVMAIVTANLSRLACTHWIPAYVAPHCRMDSLSFGALVACLEFRGYLKSTRIVLGLSFVVSAITIFASCYWFFCRDLGPLKHTIVAMIFACTAGIAVSDRCKTLNYFLTNRILGFFATISYSLYLTHFLVLGLFHEWIAGNHYIGIQSWFDVQISAAAFGTSVALSFMIYRSIELPFIKIGKRIPYTPARSQATVFSSTGI